LLVWRTSFTAAGDSCHIHSSSPFSTSDQVQGAGYSEFEVETDVTALQLETSVPDLELETVATALELETDTTNLELETDVPQETSK
jgi:hypothetical protein